MEFQVINDFETLKGLLSIAPVIDDSQLLIHPVELQAQVVHSRRDLKVLSPVLIVNGFDVGFDLNQP